MGLLCQYPPCIRFLGDAVLLLPEDDGVHLCAGAVKHADKCRMDGCKEVGQFKGCKQTRFEPMTVITTGRLWALPTSLFRSGMRNVGKQDEAWV
jgi:hypothetical protein